jgi:hypothetical protein
MGGSTSCRNTFVLSERCRLSKLTLWLLVLEKCHSLRSRQSASGGRNSLCSYCHNFSLSQSFPLSICFFQPFYHKKLFLKLGRQPWIRCGWSRSFTLDARISARTTTLSSLKSYSFTTHFLKSSCLMWLSLST